jgi:hypothetical protein
MAQDNDTRTRDDEPLIFAAALSVYVLIAVVAVRYAVGGANHVPIANAAAVAAAAGALFGAAQLAVSFRRARLVHDEGRALIRVLRDTDYDSEDDIFHTSELQPRVTRLAARLTETGYADVAADLEIAYRRAYRKARGIRGPRS